MRVCHQPAVSRPPPVRSRSGTTRARHASSRAASEVVVVLGGEVVARTRSALRVLETSHPPAFYLPYASFVDGSLVPVGGTTYCEFKGTASYFDVVAGGRRAARAGWTYRAAPAGFEALARPRRADARPMDACTVDGEVVVPQAGGFYGGWITVPRRRPVQGRPRNDGLVGEVSAYGAMAEWRLVRRPVGDPRPTTSSWSRCPCRPSTRARRSSATPSCRWTPTCAGG